MSLHLPPMGAHARRSDRELSLKSICSSNLGGVLQRRRVFTRFVHPNTCDPYEHERFERVLRSVYSPKGFYQSGNRKFSTKNLTQSTKCHSHLWYWRHWLVVVGFIYSTVIINSETAAENRFFSILPQRIINYFRYFHVDCQQSSSKNGYIVKAFSRNLPYIDWQE